MKHANSTVLALIGLACMAAGAASAAEKVTVDNFVRAETDLTMKRYAAQGAFGKFLHIRGMTPIDKQDVIRMNRDTLYSAGVFDLTTPVTIVKPEHGKRFQSMQVINQDHSTLGVEHGPGSFTFTRESVGTRYVIILLRTFADPNDPADLQAARELQDRVQVQQAGAGAFEVPEWDEASLGTVRDALNDGKTPYVLTVRDAPVDGFWSITVYNAKGFMEPNALNAYSVNDVTAKRNPDGSVTVHFGGDPGSVNYLPITEGWNYVVRMYQPRKPVVDGKWRFPEAQPAK